MYTFFQPRVGSAPIGVLRERFECPGFQGNRFSRAGIETIQLRQPQHFPQPVNRVVEVLGFQLHLGAARRSLLGAGRSLLGNISTTAKPMPASPARAASTAAFSERMLVWKAISSITRMILEIFSLEVEISFIESSIWFSF